MRKEDPDLEGRRGGYAGYARSGYAPGSGVIFFDRVRWGAAWAGVVVALASHILLNAFGVAVGLIRPMVGAVPGEISTGFGIWMCVNLLISLFLGAYFTCRLAGITRMWDGVWNGIVVWALAFALITAARSFGATFLGTGQTIANMTGGPVVPVTRATLNHIMSLNALWFLIWGLVGLVGSVIGGAVGAIAPTVVVEEPQRPDTPAA